MAFQRYQFFKILFNDEKVITQKISVINKKLSSNNISQTYLDLS